MRVSLTTQGGFAGVSIHYETKDASAEVRGWVERLERLAQQSASPPTTAQSMGMMTDSMQYEVEIEENGVVRRFSWDDSRLEGLEAIDALVGLLPVLPRRPCKNVSTPK